MTNADIAERALQDMAAVAVRPFAFPADWSEQVKACPECRRYKGHPMQQGVCNEHRRPLWQREQQDQNERRLLSTRRLDIAECALREIAAQTGAP